MPFKRFHVDQQGNVNLCYGTNWTSLSVGNVLRDPPWKIWKGSVSELFRSTITDQSFLYCSNCRIPELLDKGQGPTEHDLEVIECVVLAYDQTCNIACPSCRTNVRKPSPLAITIHRQICDSDLFKHTKTLSMFGSGEPLVSPLFWDVIERLKIADTHPELNLNLCTNGLLLTEENLDRIRLSGKPISGIEISVDAATEETYAINRRGGKWSDLLANLEHLATSGIPLRLNFVVQENNFLEMPAFVGLALRYNAEYIRFDALNNWGTYSPAEYRERAIHFPSHPKHSQLRDLLGDPRLKHPRVFLAQLSEIFSSSSSPLDAILKIKEGYTP